MTLLKELLDLNDYLDDAHLFEDLGNLKQLKLGTLAKALNQTYSAHDSESSSLTGNRIAGNARYYSSMPFRKSEIVDLGRIKRFSDIRRVYRENPSMKAVAFSATVNGKAIALLLSTADEISKPSRVAGFSYDLTELNLDAETMKKLVIKAKGISGLGYKDNVEMDADTPGKSERKGRAYKEVTRWDKDDALEADGKTSKAPKAKVKAFDDYSDWVDFAHSMREKPAPADGTTGDRVVMRDGAIIGRWDKNLAKGTFTIPSSKSDTPYNNSVDRVYTGKEVLHVGRASKLASVKEFIDLLIASDVTLYAKGALADLESAKIGQARGNNPPNPNDSLFAEKLAVRLAKYKNTKVDSVESIQAFMEKVFAKEASKITYNGKTYMTSARDESYSKPSTAASLLNGRPVTILFSADSKTGDYGDLRVVIKLVNGQIQVVS